MHIIYDPQFDEYGVLMNENFKKVVKKTHEDFAKMAPTLSEDHLFYTGGQPVAPLDLNEFPKELLDSDIPVIKFYDENKKVSDTAMYTSQNARERYQKVKRIKTLKEFFKFRKERVAN